MTKSSSAPVRRRLRISTLLRLARRRGDTLRLAGTIAAAQGLDHLIGTALGLRIGPAVVFALLLRRPTLARPGLAAAFVAELGLLLATGGGVGAPFVAALDTALAGLAFVVARSVRTSGHRVRSARGLIEALVVGALAMPCLAAGLADVLAETPVATVLDLARLADWPSLVLGGATVLPILLVAGRDEDADDLDWIDPAVFVVFAGVVAVVAWTAERWFPFPFIVAGVPLFLAAARLPPTAVAVLGAGCMIGMVESATGGVGAGRVGVSIGSLVLAAALTGVPPTGLALLLAELRSERHRLATTGERLRQVLAGIAGHGFCALDANGIVTGWNDKIARLTGFSAEAVTGHSFARFFPEQDRAAGVPDLLLERARETGRAERIGWRLRADGSRFWAQTTLETNYDWLGNVVGFVKSIQDQTELQRSQEALLAAERRWGFALGSGGQGVWEHDLVAGRLDYSDVHAAMLGLSVEELGDDPAAWKARVHPDDVAAIPRDDAGEEVGETELRLRHADGHWLWIVDRRRIAERDDAGRPIRVIGTHTDISARKLAEEKFRLAVEAMPNGLLIADASGRITLVNRETERMFGYEPGTLLGRPIDTLVPEGRPGDHAGHRATFAGHPTARRMGAGRDLNGRRRDGTLFPVEIGLNPIVTTEGTQVLCVVTDITARKLAEEKFRLAVEASPNGVLIADGSGRITLVNSETERMFGYEPGTLLGRPIDILVPESHKGEHATRRAAFSSRPTARRMGAGRDLNGRRRDGTLFPVEIGLNPIVTAEGESVLCVVSDITARKQTEAELAMSEARYRMMADHFTDLVVHLDLDLNRTWVSPASRDILGLPPAALLGRSPSGIVHPDDADEVRRALEAVAGGLDRAVFGARYRHADDRWVWMSVSLRLIRGSDGAPIGILAVGRDITRAREAEAALKASEATFRGAMEGASIGMALEELDGRWVSVNRALCRILGMEESDLLYLGAVAFTHPLDAGIDTDQRRRLLAGEISSYQVEKRWLHRAGGVIWTQQSISVDRAPDGGPRRLILQIQDVTERRQVEQMKSEFVSMVSHELRTPLTSIRGALGLVLGTMTNDLPPRAIQLVDIAHKNSERLIPLVNDILDLDKIDAGMLRVDLVEADAGQLVVQAVEATRAFADRYAVTLTLDRPPTTLPIRVDEGRFIQVVTNLLSNAAKFSPRRSRVEIEVSIVETRVRVAVRDHGPGISEEFRARIFGRFAQADSATTRAKGGSGLGLHICRQLVGLMGGRIDFESTVGVGSVFRVEFPLAAAARDDGTAAATISGRRRIAVLAGDEALADFLSTAVAEAGHEARLVAAIDASTGPSSPDTLAVLVDAALTGTPTGEALRGRLPARPDAGPPTIVIATDGSVPAAGWEDHEVWTVEPSAPHELVRRLAGLTAGGGGAIPRVLHVEDDLDLAAVLAAGLAGRAEIVCAPRLARALRALDGERFDLAVIDPVLPDGNALVLLVPHLESRGIPYLILSADETSQRAETALAHLVKSRITEPQLVDTIVALLADRRSPKEARRHAG